MTEASQGLGLKTQGMGLTERGRAKAKAKVVPAEGRARMARSGPKHPDRAFERILCECGTTITGLLNRLPSVEKTSVWHTGEPKKFPGLRAPMSPLTCRAVKSSVETKVDTNQFNHLISQWSGRTRAFQEDL